MCRSITFLLVAFLIGEIGLGQTTWTGTTDTDWHKACNWNTSSIPACGDNVIIPSTANKPNISGVAHCRTLELRSSTGARLDITGSGRLDVGLAGGCSGTATDNGGCGGGNLLPNPSFEDRSCCPSALAQMNCVDNWINAAAGGSSDYYNSCGITSSPTAGFNPPPAPLPDGTGYVGFLDYREGFPSLAPRKEFVGVCLTGALTASQSYTFDFEIAAAATGAANGVTVTIYGTTNCANMPYAGVLCPTTAPGWVVLGSVAMTPNNSTWQSGTINFTAASAYTGIIVGSSCTAAAPPPNNPQRYYYLDNLALY